MQNALRAAQTLGRPSPESARRSWSDGGRQQSDEVPPARRCYSHLVPSLPEGLSGRADLEEQGGISIAEVSRDRLLAKRTLSRVLKAGMYLVCDDRGEGVDGCSASLRQS